MSSLLTGKTVAVVHSAWHSCGSHQVFVTQVQAYAALGARVLALAVNDVPAPRDGRQKTAYFAKSADLVADHREWLAMPPVALFDRRFAKALLSRLHGDTATLRLAVAERAAVPRTLAALGAIDLVHCNHFFNMPVAHRIAEARNAPIVLETHDVQARQYDLANRSGWTLPPALSLDQLLAIELDAMTGAALLVHLNNDENLSFRAALPNARHALLYPAVRSAARGGDGTDFLIVAAGNQPNVMSVRWFLEAVVPLAPDLPYRIVGSVGREIRRSSPELFKKHRAMFTDRVDDIASAYRGAAAILLPTIAGHGISIKTIEALSSGAPLVATPQAFRGMSIDPAALSNVSVETDPTRFAAAMRAVATRTAPHSNPAAADTRRLYERMFSPAAYQRGLAALVGPLLGAGTSS